MAIFRIIKALICAVIIIILSIIKNILLVLGIITKECGNFLYYKLDVTLADCIRKVYGIGKS